MIRIWCVLNAIPTDANDRHDDDDDVEEDTADARQEKLALRYLMTAYATHPDGRASRIRRRDARNELARPYAETTCFVHAS